MSRLLIFVETDVQMNRQDVSSKNSTCICIAQTRASSSAFSFQGQICPFLCNLQNQDDTI